MATVFTVVYRLKLNWKKRRFWNQARSQDLKKGGLFWKSEKCAYDVDSRIFIDLESVSDGLSEIWDEMSRKHRKFKGFFRPKLVDLQKKKKKGLRQNSEWFFGRNPKFKRFFRPKLGDLQKKRSSPKFRVIFLPSFASSNVWGGALFVWGGLFSIFHRKSASKAQNTCVFAYFTSQCHIFHFSQKIAPPPPGYATVWNAWKTSNILLFNLQHSIDKTQILKFLISRILYTFFTRSSKLWVGAGCF